VVSAIKIIGYVLQIAGMAIMFFAFINLVTGIQHTVSSVTQRISAESGVLPISQPGAACDPQTDDMCGVDFSDDTAVEQLMSKRVYTFIAYLGAGLGLMFLGLLLRAGEELGGFLSKLRNKEGDKDRIRIPAGKLRWS
jgi:hypothetical protein